jgi:chromosome condensin MukBEF ATPase and DNA-binding subunit MukB
VLTEREFWRKPTDDLRHKISEQDERLGRLDNILGRLRELTDDADTPFDAEKAQAIIKQYRTPLEEYYDEMKKARERRSAMQEWEQELGVEKHTPAEWEEELEDSSDEAKSEKDSDEEE